jgi:hypothetical protein
MNDDLSESKKFAFEVFLFCLRIFTGMEAQ